MSLVILYAVVICIYRIFFLNPHSVSFSPQLIVDGYSYYNGAVSMIQNSFFLFLGGTFSILSKGSEKEWQLIIFPFAALLVSQLVVGSSTRFLVPYVPLIILIIAYSIKEIGKKIIRT